jgi:hypothetical protein
MWLLLIAGGDNVFGSFELREVPVPEPSEESSSNDEDQGKNGKLIPSFKNIVVNFSGYTHFH